MSTGVPEAVLPDALLAPPPRRVRRRRGARSIWGTRLFILPHTLIGIGMLLLALGEPVFYLFAHRVPARITRIDATPSSKSGRTHYRVTYAFAAQGDPVGPEGSPTSLRQASDTAPETVGRTLATGQTVDVYTLRVGPFDSSRLVLGPREYVRGRGMIFGFALFWNGILSIFHYQVWYLPYRDRRLVRFGVPTPGYIASKRISQGKQTSYYVTYRYAPPPGDLIERKCEVSRNFYPATEVGDTVTVVYDPERPKRSIVYEMGDYEVVEQRTALTP